MSNSELVNRLMFDYFEMNEEEIIILCKLLPNKILRWLGSIHPDNKTRKIFLKLTGVKIGRQSVINVNFVISDGYKNLLKIGDRVAIAPNVTVVCESAPNNSLLKNNKYIKNKLICEKEVVIKDDVWIGCNTVILPGVVIGRGAIIGAGTVVTKNVPEYCVVAGIPGKVIRHLDK